MGKEWSPWHTVIVLLLGDICLVCNDQVVMVIMISSVKIKKETKKTMVSGLKKCLWVLHCYSEITPGNCIWKKKNNALFWSDVWMLPTLLEAAVSRLIMQKINTNFVWICWEDFHGTVRVSVSVCLQIMRSLSFDGAFLNIQNGSTLKATFLMNFSPGISYSSQPTPLRERYWGWWGGTCLSVSRYPSVPCCQPN